MSYVIKNAAAYGATATTKVIREQAYRGYRPSSSPFFRKLPPGRRDRTLPRPPTPAPQQVASSDRTALGLLLLLLTAREGELAPSQQSRGWRLAQRWIRQYVEAKHEGEAA